MAGPSAPVQILIPWANSASGTFVTSPVPQASQLPGSPGRASYTDGFPPQTFNEADAGGTGPDGRDENGVTKDITSNIVNYTAGLYATFSSAAATFWSGYPAGSILSMANGKGQWINSSGAANSNNPDTSAAATSGWSPLSVSGTQSVALTSGTTTLSAVQAACNLLKLTGTVGSNVVFPPWSRVWTVLNQTTGGVTVTASSSGSGSFAIPAGGFCFVCVDASGNVTGTLSAPIFNS